MAASPLGRRRSRPVADAPVLDGSALAKAWLVELVASAPLERAASLPGPRFAEDAPALCAGVAAALSSDAAFGDLEPGGALAPLAAGAAALAAARDALEAVTALEALRASVWAEIVEAPDRPPPAAVAELADRLAAVVATLTAASLEQGGPPQSIRPGDRGPLAAVLRARPSELRPEPSPAPEPPAVEAAPLGADRFAPPEPLEDDAPPPLSVVPDDVSVSRLYDLVEDSRVEDASAYSARRLAPWTAAIERRLIRHREDGLAFSVLCVEIVDLDRLVASDRDGDVTALLEAAEAGMCAQLRPADALVRERPGRYWLTTPETGGDEARVLAHRIVAGVAAAPGHRGAALQAAVGVATCPFDGLDAGELENRAEEGLFAARAAGVRVAP